MTGANLLVAIAMGDGPDNPPIQHTTLSDTGGHRWTLCERHKRSLPGSTVRREGRAISTTSCSVQIIDVYTAPATGSEAGSVLRSELTIKRGDEATSSRCWPTANGNFGLAQLSQTVQAGEDVVTVFSDGRHNDPITLVPGFRPLSVFPVDGGPRGDCDLYQVSHLDPPGSWPGGEMLTGNLAPPGSAYWVWSTSTSLPPPDGAHSWGL